MTIEPVKAAARPVLQWTRTAMIDYLIDGQHPHHGIAAGPMQPVVDQLAQVPEAMVEAIAYYLTADRENARDEATDWLSRQIDARVCIDVR